jgi:hypothetical protein
MYVQAEKKKSLNKTTNEQSLHPLVSLNSNISRLVRRDLDWSLYISQNHEEHILNLL